MLEYRGPTILEALGPTWPGRCFRVSLNNENVAPSATTTRKMKVAVSSSNICVCN